MLMLELGPASRIGASQRWPVSESRLPRRSVSGVDPWAWPFTLYKWFCIVSRTVESTTLVEHSSWRNAPYVPKAVGRVRLRPFYVTDTQMSGKYFLDLHLTERYAQSFQLALRGRFSSTFAFEFSS